MKNPTNIKNYFLILVVMMSAYAESASAQADCSSIRDPQLMYECVVDQRKKNLTKTPNEITKKHILNDWKKVLEMDAGQNGKMTFFYSPGSAKFMEMSDPQSAIGKSRVVVVNTLQNFSKPQKIKNGSIKSTLITAVYHCERPGLKEIETESFAENMARGKSLSVSKTSIDDMKWSPFSDGDDVITDDVRRVCPPIGPVTPQKPLKIMFYCSDKSPGTANFKVRNILITLAKDGPQTASHMIQSYGTCFAQQGDVKNPEFWKRAKTVVTKGDLVYFVIDTSEELSFGVVGSN